MDNLTVNGICWLEDKTGGPGYYFRECIDKEKQLYLRYDLSYTANRTFCGCGKSYFVEVRANIEKYKVIDGITFCEVVLNIRKANQVNYIKIADNIKRRTLVTLKKYLPVITMDKLQGIKKAAIYNYSL